MEDLERILLPLLQSPITISVFGTSIVSLLSIERFMKVDVLAPETSECASLASSTTPDEARDAHTVLLGTLTLTCVRS